jgi:hypothetical protein
MLHCFIVQLQIRYNAKAATKLSPGKYAIRLTHEVESCFILKNVLIVYRCTLGKIRFGFSESKGSSFLGCNILILIYKAIILLWFHIIYFRLIACGIVCMN